MVSSGQQMIVNKRREKGIMKGSFFRVVVLASLVVLSSCAPRGETITLDEVLSRAEKRYSEASTSVKLTGEAQTGVASLSSQVRELASRLPRAKQSSGKTIEPASLKGVSEGLAEMVTRAGYTNRAAMSELAEQFRVLSTQPKVDAAQVKLLVARTYSVISSELETTKFSVS